jgi:SAM-dependent methyltransferase
MSRSNPWLEIPLEDYETHMALPSVAQASYLAQTLFRWVKALNPSSVAVLGCSGGNGFDVLPPAQVHRVVGVDINPAYLAVAEKRFHNRFQTLELIPGDLLSPSLTFAPVDLVFAALIFEYVSPRRCLPTIIRFLKPGGKLGVILQQETPAHPAITPSGIPSLRRLEGHMRLISTKEFEEIARSEGMTVHEKRRRKLDTGKIFSELLLVHLSSSSS